MQEKVYNADKSERGEYLFNNEFQTLSFNLQLIVIERHIFGHHWTIQITVQSEEPTNRYFRTICFYRCLGSIFSKILAVKNKFRDYFNFEILLLLK